MQGEVGCFEGHEGVREGNDETRTVKDGCRKTSGAN